LAYNNLAWSHGNDLIIEQGLARMSVGAKRDMITESQSGISEKKLPNIVVLRDNGIDSLFHFTDAMLNRSVSTVFLLGRD
jgi:hypothetical protein